MHGIEEDLQQLVLSHLPQYTSDGYEPNRLLRGGIGRVRSDANEYLEVLNRRGLDVYFCQLECESWDHKAEVPINLRYVHFISRVRTAADLNAFNEPFNGMRWYPDGVLTRVIYVVPTGTINR